MDLTTSAIAGWHALLPNRLKAAIPDDATVNWDVKAALLVADLTLDGSDVVDVLRRHAGTVAGFGAARRVRALAWVATRMEGSTIGLAVVLADERIAGLRPVFLADLELLAGAATGRFNCQRTMSDGTLETAR